MKKCLATIIITSMTLTYCGVTEENVQIGGKQLSEWIKQLQSDNRGLQLRAARTLSEAPVESRPTIVPKVIPLLKSERENDKIVSAQILGEYGA